MSTSQDTLDALHKPRQELFKAKTTIESLKTQLTVSRAETEQVVAVAKHWVNKYNQEADAHAATKDNREYMPTHSVKIYNLDFEVRND